MDTITVPVLEELVLGLIRSNGRWGYYAADVDVWVMDWDKWGKGFVDAGHRIPAADARERGGVLVLTEETAGRALLALEDKRVPEEHLRDLLRAASPIVSWDQVQHLLPAVFIDFDSKTLVSLYSETLELERYVPAGWEGRFGEFYDQVPVGHKYWLDGEHDYLGQALAR